MRQIAVEQRDDAVRCRRQEHPAQDNAADGARSDDDIRQPVCARHDARHREDDDDEQARGKGLLAEIAQHVEREDQEHHAVVAREARARPVLGRPARELRDAQHGHTLQREELRRARPLKAEHHVELLGDHGRHEHGQADAEHPAPPLSVLQPIVVVEDAKHEEKRHGVERPQIREGHQVEQGLALPNQVIEEEKDRFVNLIPKACLYTHQNQPHN